MTLNDCTCREPHAARRVVLTGGPGAGKTAVLELTRLSFCRHMRVLPEAAGVVFGGGFPRGDREGVRRAAQRAIFHVQRELEAAAEADGAAIMVCDRGTVDGAAYWPGGPGDLWWDVGADRERELLRYAAVFHLRPPASGHGYNRVNPLRIETAEEAARIDARIAAAWDGHPRRFIVEPESDFILKARRVLALLQAEMPACCRAHLRLPEGPRLGDTASHGGEPTPLPGGPGRACS